MIDFHQDFNNLTIEQLRTRHDKYVEERENLLKKAEKDSASFSPDKQRRLADLSDWIEASEAPRDKRDHATLGGFTGIPTVSASEERNQYLKFGQYLQAVAASGSPAGQRYGMFESGRMYQNILEPEARATGLAESIPSLGGFLVGSDMSNDIFMRVHKTSKVWDLVRKLPISQMQMELRYRRSTKPQELMVQELVGFRPIGSMNLGTKQRQSLSSVVLSYHSKSW